MSALQTYRLVPFSGSTGTQLVDGRADALAIAQEIADREPCRVAVYGTGDGHNRLVRDVDPRPVPRVFVAGPEGARHGELRVFSNHRDAAVYAARVGGWWLGREVLADATPGNVEVPR